MPVSHTLDSGVARHLASPATFELPSSAEREGLKPGGLAKLIFRISHGDQLDVERMWVVVSEVRPEYYIGRLDNDPYCTTEIQSGLRVEFHADHVIQIKPHG